MGLVIGARRMDVDDFGLFSVIQTVVGILSVAADRGLRTAAVQTWTATDRRGGLVGALGHRIRIVNRMALGTLVAGCLIASWTRIGYVEVASSSAILWSVGPLGNAETLLRIREKFGQASLLQGGLGLAFGIGAAIAGILKYGATLGLFVAALASLSLAVASMMVRPRSGCGRSDSHRTLMQRANNHLAVGMSVALYTRSERIVVGVLLGTGAAGVYSAAYNLILIFAIAGSVLTMTLLPVGRRHLQGNVSDATLRRLATLVFAFGLMSTIAILTAWSPLVRVLTGGQITPEQVFSTRPLALLAGLYLANGFLSAMLIARNLERILSRLAILLGLAAPPIYIVGTSRFGLGGVVVASVGVEIVGLTVQSVAVARSILRQRKERTCE